MSLAVWLVGSISFLLFLAGPTPVSSSVRPRNLNSSDSLPRKVLLLVQNNPFPPQKNPFPSQNNPFSPGAGAYNGASTENPRTKEKGHWEVISGTVTIGGCDKIYSAAGLVATITNAKGTPSCEGDYIDVSNPTSDPIYFGFSGVINKSLEPKKEQLYYEPEYRSRSQTTCSQAPIIVRYWHGD
jgi:hypothetical protein